MTNRIKAFLFLIADIAALYAALFVTLIIRYQGGWYTVFATQLAAPFALVFILWIIIFYIVGLYDLRRLRNNIEFLKALFLCLGIGAAIAVALFYLIPAFGVAPKTNLVIFIIAFAVIEVVWRRAVNRIISSGEAPNKLLLIGSGTAAQEVVDLLRNNPQLGYEVKEWFMKDDEATLERIAAPAEAGTVNTIVIPRHLKQDRAMANLLYRLFSAGIEIHDFTNFYEMVLGKVPLNDLEETWFLENLFFQDAFSVFLKRITDFVFILILTAIAIPLVPLIALAIAITSRGPVILTQTRIGKNGKPYDHYKFRTMHVSEKNTWLDEDAKRITAVGKFLRRTHLDELPQVVNVLRGDISLVGPRPDYVDFYNKLKDVIPYYSIRTIMKPGLTGWAQVNFPATVSIEETKERLSYDLYYLKNRSAVLDILIVLKTIRTVLGALGR
jgi:exopolysaccharide biosynthesis polyprenyl glycosylphosphotransferase